MPRNEPKNILGLDLETTGLDPVNDEILEFGVVVCDRQLNELTRFRALVQCDVDAAYSKASDYVRNMHAENGLWADLRRGEYRSEVGVLFHYAQPIPEIVAAIKDIATAYDCVGGPPLGNTVHFDRRFIDAHALGLNEIFNHRVFDVSTLLQWFRWQGQSTPVLTGLTAHRALDDVLYSFETLRQMRGMTL